MAAVLAGCLLITASKMSPDVAPQRGIVSQPSVSMKLLRAQTIEAGSEIWAEDETDGGEEVWMLVQVLRQDNTLLMVRKKKTGEELEIDLVRMCGVTTVTMRLTAAVCGRCYCNLACVVVAQHVNDAVDSCVCGRCSRDRGTACNKS